VINCVLLLNVVIDGKLFRKLHRSRKKWSVVSGQSRLPVAKRRFWILRLNT